MAEHFSINRGDGSNRQHKNYFFYTRIYEILAKITAAFNFKKYFSKKKERQIVENSGSRM